MAEDNTGAYNSGRESDIQISRTPSRGYNKDSAMDLLVARNEVNRQTQQFLDQIKNMTTEINGILKSIEDSNSKGSKSLEKSATLFLARMKEAQKTGEISTKNQLDFMKDYAKILSKAAETTITTKGVTDEQIKNANRLLKMSDEYIQKAKEFNEALENSADNMASRLSKGLGSIRKDFQDLANTLNIDKLVNGSSISSRIGIMNQTKQNFGLTTNREFENFKNDLVNQMQGLNDKFGQSLLGSDDLKNYLQMSSQIGLTETSVAQDQLEALLIGNKYLGESIETQSQLYKYMKRTGDTDITDKYNKMIVGLLQSDLNVSKEQLDAFNRQNVEQLDYLNTLGWSPEEQENALKNMNALQTAASDLGLDGESIMGVLNTLYNSGVYNGVPELLGSSFKKFREQYRNQDFLGALNTLINDSSFKGISSSVSGAGSDDSIVFNALKKSLGFDGSIISELAKASTKLSEINSNYGVANDSMDTSMNDKDSVTDYVKNTTIAGFGERLMNWLGLKSDKIPWSTFVTLGNTAFTLFIAEKGFSALGKLPSAFKNVKNFISNTGGTLKTIYQLFTSGEIGKFFKGGGSVKELFSTFFGGNSNIGKSATNLTSSGAGGKALGMLGAGATVVGLTAAAIAGISAAANAMTKSEHEAADNNYQDNLNKLKGTAYEGNSGVAQTMGLNNKIGTASSDSTSDRAGSYFSLGNFAKNFLGQSANSLVGWLNNFNKGDPAKYNTELWNNYQRTIHGLWSDEQLQALEFAYALALDSVGSFSTANSLFKIDGKSMANWLQNLESADTLQNALKTLWKNNLKPVGSDGSTWDGSVDLDSWYKNGKWYNKYGTGGAGDKAGLGANMGGGSPVPSGYPWTGTAGYPTYPSGKKHTGIDFGISQGTPVGAAVSGTVAQVNDSGSKGYGRHVIVQGDNGKWFVYGHLSQPKVSKGQHVEAGNLIGLSGNTGNSTGPHLHFEARNNSRYGSDISPYPYLTNGLFSPNGQASGNLVQANTTANSEDDTKTDLNKQAGIRYNTRISALSGVTTLGMGGAEPDTTSLESTMNKKFDELIGVITSLSERQDSDSMILQALSNSTRRPAEFGGVR